MQIIFLILLFIVGSCLGSFCCCSARRIHLKENTKGRNHQKINSRSICLDCGKQLKWYDNIPIISWLILRGKCRYCHKKIGIAEFLSEIGFGLAFLGLGTTINIENSSILTWAIFIITLLFITTLGFLAIYDGIYGELPTTYLIISIILSIIIAILKEFVTLSTTQFSFNHIFSPFASVAILGGIYFLLFMVSKGKWVGNGDWILGTALGFALSSPWLALITLFIANVLACLVMAPAVKKFKNKLIHFGPFMVVAFVIVLTFSKFFLALNI